MLAASLLAGVTAGKSEEALAAHMPSQTGSVRFATMGCEEKKQSARFANLAIVKKSKGNVFAEKPVFYDNGNSLIICFDNSLHLYSTSTGDHVKELFRSSCKIISCQLHPSETSQLVVVTENGELIVYNLKTNEVEHSLRLTLNQKFLNKQKAPKFHSSGQTEMGFNWETQALDSLSERRFFHAEVKPFQNNPSEVFVWTTWCLNDEEKCHLSVFTFNSGKHIRLIHTQNTGLRKHHLNFVLGTVQNYEVFVGMSRNCVHVSRYDTQKQPFSVRHSIGMNKEVTCLAFHPTECSFATGDSLGRIIIWKNIFEREPLKDLLHWHAHEVHTIFFSKFGNYMFSGGEENVLVKWSLNSHNKDFLPRLSSVIHHITGSCEESLLSVSTMDNKILILDFNFNKVSTIQHFSAWSVVKGKTKGSIFAVDPRTECLVLNGRTGHIQFLSMKEDGKFLYTFDITNKTLISDADFMVENTEVTHAVFSRDGRWMITAESRGEVVCKESRLKFWLYCDKQNSFKLNTNVEFPHDEYEINSLEMSVDDVVATAGGDKKFRLWSPFEHEQDLKRREFWGVHTINKYRNFPCRAIDFSKDASLIGVTFGPVLTVWETETCVLKCALSAPDRKDELKFCKFGNYELSHLVVTGSKSVISCWNVITLSITWTVPLELSLLVSDPFSVFMAAFSHNDSLIIFSPSSPTPDLVLNKVADGSRVTAAHCTLPETGKFCLYFLTQNQQLFCLEDAERTRETVPSHAGHSFSTPYSLQLAEKRNRAEFDRRKTILLNKNNRQSVASLLDSPAHALPNPSLLCLDVLKGLLAVSENRAGGPSAGKEVKQMDVVRRVEAAESSATVDSDKVERKLLNFVKTMFV